MLSVLRANFAVYKTYSYTAEAPLDCPISVFGGLEDKRVSQDDLAAWRVQTDAQHLHAADVSRRPLLSPRFPNTTFAGPNPSSLVAARQGSGG